MLVLGETFADRLVDSFNNAQYVSRAGEQYKADNTIYRGYINVKLMSLTYHSIFISYNLYSLSKQLF